MKAKKAIKEISSQNYSYQCLTYIDWPETNFYHSSQVIGRTDDCPDDNNIVQMISLRYGAPFYRMVATAINPDAPLTDLEVPIQAPTPLSPPPPENPPSVKKKKGMPPGFAQALNGHATVNADSNAAPVFQDKQQTKATQMPAQPVSTFLSHLFSEFSSSLGVCLCARGILGLYVSRRQ